jgi:hypothetical protein
VGVRFIPALKGQGFSLPLSPIPVIEGGMTEIKIGRIQTRKETQAPKMVRKVLLICGILSSLLYAGIDALGGMSWKGYSFTSQPVSDLGAIGSPVRTLVSPLFIVYDVLFIAFALGVWAFAGRKRAVRVVGGLLVGNGVLNFVAVFTPEHLGEAPATLGNTMHIAAAGVTVLLFLLQLGVGAIAFGKRFRLYSVGTLLTVLVLGAYIFSGVNAGLLVPWVGVEERILIYGYMLWVVVLAIVLLGEEKKLPSIQETS